MSINVLPTVEDLPELNTYSVKKKKVKCRSCCLPLRWDYCIKRPQDLTILKEVQDHEQRFWACTLHITTIHTVHNTYILYHVVVMYYGTYQPPWMVSICGALQTEVHTNVVISRPFYGNITSSTYMYTNSTWCARVLLWMPTHTYINTHQRDKSVCLSRQQLCIEKQHPPPPVVTNRHAKKTRHPVRFAQSLTAGGCQTTNTCFFPPYFFFKTQCDGKKDTE